MSLQPVLLFNSHMSILILCWTNSNWFTAVQLKISSSSELLHFFNRSWIICQHSWRQLYSPSEKEMLIQRCGLRGRKIYTSNKLHTCRPRQPLLYHLKH